MQAPPEQACPQAPQLFGSLVQSAQVPLQSCVVVGHVQLPLTHCLPPMHGDGADSTKHPCMSCEQVTSDDVLAQTLPTELQRGSVLHVHIPAPAAPVQLWFVPQATGAP
jgi:hypothetical protein